MPREGMCEPGSTIACPPTAGAGALLPAPCTRRTGYENAWVSASLVKWGPRIHSVGDHWRLYFQSCFSNYSAVGMLQLLPSAWAAGSCVLVSLLHTTPLTHYSTSAMNIPNNWNSKYWVATLPPAFTSLCRCRVYPGQVHHSRCTKRQTAAHSQIHTYGKFSINSP